MPDNQALRFFCPAKLNLFLHINGQRPDGYHNLQTLFQLLDYGDDLWVKPVPVKPIQFKPIQFKPISPFDEAHHQVFALNQDYSLLLSSDCDALVIEDNLIVKAAKLLIPHAKTPCDLSLHLTKRLPMGGGIGGGSSNAATTLLALNQVWQCELGRSELSSIGLRLGADVPVFVEGRSAFAEGVGEKLQAIDLPNKWYLVVVPNCHVSTAEIFSHKRLTRDTPIIKVAPTLERDANNDCQALVSELYPEIKNALDWLNNYGKAKLTGTGCCIFASFESKPKAEAALKNKPDQWQAFLAKGINKSQVAKG